MSAVAVDDVRTAIVMIHVVESVGCEAVSGGAGSIWKESIAEAIGPPDCLAVTVAR